MRLEPPTEMLWRVVGTRPFCRVMVAPADAKLSMASRRPLLEFFEPFAPTGLDPGVSQLPADSPRSTNRNH